MIRKQGVRKRERSRALEVHANAGGVGRHFQVKQTIISFLCARASHMRSVISLIAARSCVAALGAHKASARKLQERAT